MTYFHSCKMIFNYLFVTFMPNVCSMCTYMQNNNVWISSSQLLNCYAICFHVFPQGTSKYLLNISSISRALFLSQWIWYPLGLFWDYFNRCETLPIISTGVRRYIRVMETKEFNEESYGALFARYLPSTNIILMYLEINKVSKENIKTEDWRSYENR